MWSHRRCQICDDSLPQVSTSNYSIIPNFFISLISLITSLKHIKIYSARPSSSSSSSKLKINTINYSVYTTLSYPLSLARFRPLSSRHVRTNSPPGDRSLRSSLYHKNCHTRSSRFWANFKKCGPNRLLKKWVNFAGGGGSGSALIRKLKFWLLHLCSFSSTFPVKKFKFIVRGTPQLHAVCPRTNFRKLWVAAFHHPRLKHLKKLLELTVCSSSPSFVVVPKTIPKICLGNSPIFSSSAHTISPNLVSRVQDLAKVVDRFIATYPHCRGYIASRLFRIRLFPCSPISYLPIPYSPILCWPILYSPIPCLPIPFSPTPCWPIPCLPIP